MTAVVDAASPDERLRLLRAHPDLGTRARMSDASVGEQQGAGLDRLSAAEFERLQRLNSAYREKFGLPFLFAVKGSTKHDVLAALAAPRLRIRTTSWLRRCAKCIESPCFDCRICFVERAGGP